MTHIRAGGLVAALVVLTAACSGSEEAGGTSTSPPTTAATTAVPTSTAAAPTTTTTIASTTAISATTQPVPATTEAPTTTVAPVASTGREVGDALIEAREAYLYAVYNLDAPDAAQRLAATHAAGSPSLELAQDNVQTLVDNGWLARPNPEIPDTVTIESDVTMLDETTAELVVCIVGAGEVYDPGAADDGSDLVINGEIEAALDRVTMVLEDGRWKLREGTNLTTESGTACVVE